MSFAAHSRIPSPQALVAAGKMVNASRADGWFSALTGYGVEGRDKRVSARFQGDELDEKTIEDLWLKDDIASRIIEVIPDEAMRPGYELTVGDKKLAEDLLGQHEELKVDETFRYAKKAERAFGGAAIMPIINDSQKSMSTPLNEDRITKIEHLQVFLPSELRPNRYYNNPLKPKFGMPETYILWPQSRGVVVGSGGVEVHETRLIIFPGIRVTRTQMSANQWGESVMNRCYGILRDYNISWAAATAILHDFAQAAFKIKGLAQLIAQDRDDVIRARIQAVELARSTIRAVLMDSEEEFERKATPTAGLAELLREALTRLAMTADMPIVRLAGTSPAGFSTGDSETRQWYDRVDVIRKLGIKPQLAQFCRLQMKSLQGPTKGKEPNRWSVNFKPLWQMSETEQAAYRKTIAETDAIQVGLGMVSAEEATLSRWGGDAYSPEMQIDFKERARLNALGETAGEAAPTGDPLADATATMEDPGEDPIEGEEPTDLPKPGKKGKAPAKEEVVDVEEVDDDGDPSTAAAEYVTIQVQGHARRLRLRRKRTGEPKVTKTDAGRYKIKLVSSGEWYVYDTDGEVVGEWDKKTEALEHARVLEASDLA